MADTLDINALAREHALPPDHEFVNPAEDPAALAKASAALANTVKDPEPEPPADTLVQLPGGIVRGALVIRQAEVRELTGEHEEALARAARAQPGSVVHFLSTLLECGTVRFGTEDPAQTSAFLRDALVGDRDALLIGIRRATYGDDIELEDWKCPECKNRADLTIPLDDIPVHKLEHPDKDITFDVPLRRGRTAEVRLANGADQAAVFASPDLTVAERDSILLGRCLLAIRDKDGTRHLTTGTEGALARKLALPDRHAILRDLTEKQPGPKFGEVKFTHQDCGKEVGLALGLPDLFQDLNVA
jgi:hypothetical protein